MMIERIVRQAKCEASRELFCCKLTKGNFFVRAHDGSKMLGYIEKLRQLGFVMDHQLCVDLVLQYNS